MEHLAETELPNLQLQERQDLQAEEEYACWQQGKR
jgi:hypothetical protein